MSVARVPAAVPARVSTFYDESCRPPRVSKGRGGVDGGRRAGIPSSRVTVAVEHLRDAGRTAADEESWTRCFLSVLLDLLDADFVVQLDVGWSAGQPVLGTARGVRRSPADASRVVDIPHLRVLPEFEPLLLSELLTDSECAVRLSSQTVRLLAGVPLLTGRRAVLVPVLVQGVQAAGLVVSQPPEARPRIDGLADDLGPLLALHATGLLARRTARVDAIGHPLQAILEAVVGFGADGTIREANPAAELLLQASESDLRGSDIRRILPSRTVEDFLRAASRSALPVHADVGIVHRPGNQGAQVAMTLLATSPGVFHAVLSDRSDLERSRRRLANSLSRFRTFADEAPVGIIQVDTAFDCTYVNQRWCTIHGMEPEEAWGVGWISSLPRADAERVLQDLRDAMMARQGFRTQVRLSSAWRRGTWVEINAQPVVTDDGALRGFIGTTLDVTAQRDAEERLRRMALRDPLTDLANRTALARRLEELGGRRAEDVAAVLYMDLDGFKSVNDTYGHAVGDEVLRQVALRLRATVCEDDLVARVGGDEFVVVLTGLLDAASAERAAADIRSALVTPIQVEGGVMRVTPSIGITLSRPGLSEDDLLRRADAAMYQAKSAGKNTIAFYSSVSDRNDLRLDRMAQDAHRAAIGGRFGLDYQLIADVGTSRIIGAEALLRWREDRYEAVSPSRFVSLLEDQGLIHEVAHAAMRQACAQMVCWLRDGLMPGDAHISVNVSPYQIRRQGWFDEVRSVLEETGLPPQNLLVEVTESVVLGDLGEGRSALDALGDLGVSIALDDFGTGYASLSALRTLPLDMLKIDRQRRPPGRHLAGGGGGRGDRHLRRGAGRPVPGGGRDRPGAGRPAAGGGRGIPGGDGVGLRRRHARPRRAVAGDLRPDRQGRPQPRAAGPRDPLRHP